jgi:hypothetical protein
LSCAQFGNWELEVDQPVPYASLTAGSAFLSTSAIPVANAPVVNTFSAPKLGTALPARTTGPGLHRPGTKQPAVQSGAPEKALPDGAHLLHKDEDDRNVYIDRFLTRSLRPHQLEGVQFLVNVRRL